MMFLATHAVAFLPVFSVPVDHGQTAASGNHNIVVHDARVRRVLFQHSKSDDGPYANVAFDVNYHNTVQYPRF